MFFFFLCFRGRRFDSTSHVSLAVGFAEQNMPDDIVLKDDASAWVGPSGEEIRAGVDVRLKIISAGVQATHLVRVLSSPPCNDLGEELRVQAYHYVPVALYVAVVWA